MLEHGGRLLQAAQRYGLPPESWLDLSTGINPIPWQGLTPPTVSWNRLPENEDGLIDAARAYYRASHVLAVAGSQAAIQCLPRIRPIAHVGVLAPGYNEHGYRWRQAGHTVISLTAAECASAVDQLDVLVLCNPNNPGGERFTPEPLLDWHARLSTRGGWLVLDEAFVDATPAASLARFTDREGLIVLRSLGKFFGLAGARVGFVLAAPKALDALDAWLGPWTIAGPSRAMARAALGDRAWQDATQQRLRQDSARLAELLVGHGLAPAGGCELFQWVLTPHAPVIHDALARRGILARRFDSPVSLRFGLPATAIDWQRLEQALQSLRSLEIGV